MWDASLTKCSHLVLRSVFICCQGGNHDTVDVKISKPMVPMGSRPFTISLFAYDPFIDADIRFPSSASRALQMYERKLSGVSVCQELGGWKKQETAEFIVSS